MIYIHLSLLSSISEGPYLEFFIHSSYTYTDILYKLYLT